MKLYNVKLIYERPALKKKKNIHKSNMFIFWVLEIKGFGIRALFQLEIEKIIKKKKEIVLLRFFQHFFFLHYHINNLFSNLF